MNNNFQLSVERLDQLPATDIVLDPAVRERYIQVRDTIWGDGEASYARESVHFNTILREAEGGKLQRATHFSIFLAFLDIAINGLSLEPGPRALCYLVGRNRNEGTKDHPKWVGECKVLISGYGELVSRARAGQIKYADNPVLVYESDEFSFSEVGGQKRVDYVCHLPHTGKIIASFIKIVRNDNSIDYAVLYEEDCQRLKDYSDKQNRGRGANELYSSGREGGIDPGFLRAKCIKHAFASYPKVRVGRATIMATDEAEQPISDDIYGIAQTNTGSPGNHDNPQDSFAAPVDTSAGLVIDPAAESSATADDGVF